MTAERPEKDTIETDVPARLDRLPWSGFHWMIVVGLMINGSYWVGAGAKPLPKGQFAPTESGQGPERPSA